MSTKQTTHDAFRVGLLGAGVISSSHATALQRLAGCRMAAVCDRDSQKAEAAGKQWNIPAIFSSLEEMLAKADLDVVHVLLPPSAHAAAAIQCLEAGKHVLVEKPFCLSTKECDAIQSAAANAGKLVAVNHNLTFMPGVVAVCDEIHARKLGEIQHVTVMYNMLIPVSAAGQRSQWMFGGGKERLIFELGPHPLSLICRLLGSVSSAATAVSGEIKLNSGQLFYDTWQASLICERGTAQMTLAVGREYSNTWLHVVGQDGEAFVDLRRNTVRVSGKTKYQRADNLVDSWRACKQLMSCSLRNFADYWQGAIGLKPTYELQNISMLSSLGDFYRALARNRTPAADAQEGTAVVKACEAIVESANQFIECQGNVYAVSTR